jgi:restriction system protein
LAIPDFQTIMRPLLVALEDGQERTSPEIRDALATEFCLTEEELAEMIPSGRAKTFANRVAWAITHTYQARLLERPRRSVYRITPRGTEVLATQPVRVDLKILAQFQEYQEFRTKGTPSNTTTTTGNELALISSDQTPEEQIGAAYGSIRSALVADLLERLADKPPRFFERLVLDVLRAMGYGGVGEDSTSHLGQSGDEGVGGVIREDELGLDLIYVQAKRWANPVGRPEIQKFFGALHGKRASKGRLHHDIVIHRRGPGVRGRRHAPDHPRRRAPACAVDDRLRRGRQHPGDLRAQAREPRLLRRRRRRYNRTARAANAPLNRRGLAPYGEPRFQANRKRAELVLKRPGLAWRNEQRRTDAGCHSTVVLQAVCSGCGRILG